jgi:hypothetical protein
VDENRTRNMPNAAGSICRDAEFFVNLQSQSKRLNSGQIPNSSQCRSTRVSRSNCECRAPAALVPVFHMATTAGASLGSLPRTSPQSRPRRRRLRWLRIAPLRDACRGGRRSSQPTVAHSTAFGSPTSARNRQADVGWRLSSHGIRTNGQPFIVWGTQC